MTIENKVADSANIENQIKPEKPKDNFFVGLFKDCFQRKDLKRPNYSRDQKLGYLAGLCLFGILFGGFYCNEKAKEAKVKGLPSIVIRLEDSLKNNDDIKMAIVRNYIRDSGLQRYALAEMEKRNRGNQEPNTLIVPYLPEK